MQESIEGLNPQTYRVFADAVLLLHAAVVVFVVGGLALIPVGNLRRWPWVNAFSFRVVHLTAIAVVALQAWLGRLCPFTTLEMWLRAKGGQSVYSESFIEHWVQRVIYHDAPVWMFTLAYTLCAVLVAGVWWRFPPRSRRRRGDVSGA